ncbi:MAG TPA: hypothetical protein VGQ73_02175 [Gemmatimonadales bacterium]|nr:hypothetical protein [Gemmatimonadales bacterium]
MSAPASSPPGASPGARSLNAGANLVALAGIGLIGYGLLFLQRNFHGFIELGLTPEQVGGTPEQIHGFSPHLYHYISHLQVAVSAFIIAVGVAVIMLAVRGIKSGQRWALWTAFFAPVIGVGIALPLHYHYGLATLGHLGPIYADAAILLIGTIVAVRGMPR